MQVLPGRVRQHMADAPVALDHGGGEAFGLLKRDVGWQGCHLGVAAHLQEHRSIGGKRARPSACELFRLIHHHRFKTHQFGEASIGQVGQVLAGRVARVAFHDPLFPGDLVEIAVVEHAHDQSRV